PRAGMRTRRIAGRRSTGTWPEGSEVDIAVPISRNVRARVAAIAALALAPTCAGGSALALRVPSAPRCPVFPKTNPWNRRVDRLPVAANSTAIIASIGVDTGLHADFGSGLWQGSPIGIPFHVVTRRMPR